MSCNACSAIIDCADFGGIVGDLSPSAGFFATQDYSFLLDCPTGYFCFPGYYPRIITIPRGDIPEATLGDGGRIFLLGCQSMISRIIPVGASAAQVQALAGQVFAEWARQAANCANINTGPRPGIPPPTLIPTGKGSKINLENEEQCVTAHCVPENAGDPRTDCVEAGAWELTLFDASPEQVAAAQAHLNASALKEATDGAQALLRCGVCNAALHGFQACAGDPSKIASADIAAGKYCSPIGTLQGVVDAKASADLTNQLNALLAGLGCVCPGATTVAATGVTTNVCDCTYTWNLNSPFNVTIGPGGFNPFNPAAQFLAFNGKILAHGAISILTPATCSGPQILFCNP